MEVERGKEECVWVRREREGVSEGGELVWRGTGKRTRRKQVGAGGGMGLRKERGEQREAKG